MGWKGEDHRYHLRANVQEMGTGLSGNQLGGTLACLSCRYQVISV